MGSSRERKRKSARWSRIKGLNLITRNEPIVRSKLHTCTWRTASFHSHLPLISVLSPPQGLLRYITLWASVERASSKRCLSIGSAAPVSPAGQGARKALSNQSKSGSRHCRELFVPHTLFDIDCIIPGDMGEFLCCQAQPWRPACLTSDKAS